MALTVIGFLLWVEGVYAISLSTQYIAYVDIEKVFDQFYKTQQVEKELAASRKSQPKKMEELKNRIAALKEQLLTAPTTSLQAQLQTAETELEELPNLQKQKEETLTKELMGEIYEQIKDICSERGYTVVLDKRMAIYGTEEIDITGEVLRRLNADRPAEEIVQPAEEEIPEEVLPPTTGETTLSEGATETFVPEEKRLLPSTTEEVLEELLSPTTAGEEVEFKGEPSEELKGPTTSAQPFLKEPTTGPLQLPEELQPPTTE